jgi:ice-binding like protein
LKLFKYPALLGLLTLAFVATLTFTGAGEAAGTVVPLGTAAPFAVLAGSGITNTGATTINGDSGSSPTATESGFGGCPAANCVSQTGTNHVGPDPNDSATQSAKVALTNAYNVAAGQTPTTIPTELAGQSLAPGVYNSASGTFGMTGTLTLNAGNDPNAVFIFQTADGTGTLITGSTGNVSLIGQAQSCNVFWKVGSSATLGGGSTFRGTIMANTSISLGAVVTVDGRLLAGEQPSGTGAVTLINDTIATPTCAAPVVTPAPATTASTTTIATATAPTVTTPTTTSPTAAAAAARAAKAAKAKAAASKAASVAKVAAAKALAARKTALAVAKKAAILKKAAARKRATAKHTATSTSVGNARPPVRHVGLTG